MSQREIWECLKNSLQKIPVVYLYLNAVGSGHLMLENQVWLARDQHHLGEVFWVVFQGQKAAAVGRRGPKFQLTLEDKSW